MYEEYSSTSAPAQPTSGTGTLVALHALSWLVVANLVGCWLAAALLWPSLGDLTAPLAYGRWTNLHLNLHLYGWCSLPLVGLLFRMYLPRENVAGASLALQAWSGALLFAATGWLGGHLSGKPFMEWTGAARAVFPAAMLFLAAVLTAGYVRRLRQTSEPALLRAGKFLLLVLLFGVPFVMYWAASPELYPPINPDSGGATGGSLLGSTLGVVAVILAFPLAAGFPLRRGPFIAVAWALLAAHFAWFESLDHGQHSHLEPVQIAAIASLFLWVPLLAAYLSRFAWPAEARPWLAASFAWGATLAVTAFVLFLPHDLDRWKFTNVLVGHTHLAMAGMLSCLLVLVLVSLDGAGRWRAALVRRRAFWCWHGGALAMVVSLKALGAAEAADPSMVYQGAPAAFAAYAVRLASGLLMTWASIDWWIAAARAYRSAQSRPSPAAPAMLEKETA